MKLLQRQIIKSALCLLLVLCLSWSSALAQTYVILRPGDRGQEVKNLQLALLSLQYALLADGAYGPMTEQAVRAFQQKEGLTVDGKAGRDTQKILYARAPQYAPGQNEQNSAGKPNVPKSSASGARPKGILRPGDNADSVRTVQQRLIDLGYLQGRADAVYGKGTRRAVELFQRQHALKVNGTCDSLTMDTLFSAGAQYFTGPQATALPQTTAQPQMTALPQAPNPPQNHLRQPNGTLRPGDNADSVRTVQQRLIDLGYLQGRADAVYGKGTRRAVERFQQQNGLKVDGACGQMTMNLLFSANARRSAEPLPTAAPHMPQATVLPQTPQQSDKVIGKAYVNTQGTRTLNFRNAPHTNNTMLYALKKGTELDVLEKGAQWTRVRHNGTTGYVMTSYLSFGGQTAGQPTEKPQDNTPQVSPAPNGSDSFGAAFDKPANFSTLKIDQKDGSGQLVTLLQKRLKELGFSVKVNGTYDVATHQAVVGFQDRNGLTVTGIADTNTQRVLYGAGAKGAGAPARGLSGDAGKGLSVGAGQVQLLHWYKDIKPSIRTGQTATVYHPKSGLHFQVRFYSLGSHADSEPRTYEDTQIMNKAFGHPSWNTNTVYVKLPSGTWTLASMHNRMHLSGGILDNGFGGHLCIHFLRDMDETQRNDPNYGVTNQKTIRSAWKSMTGQEIAN